MKGTLGVLRHAILGAALVASTLAFSSAGAGATSFTANEASSTLLLCGVTKGPSVRVSSTNGCVVHVLVGANVHFTLGAGFRWGDPFSSSPAVIVTSISRDSIGVTAATVHAAKIGRAQVRVTGIKYCKPGVACPDLALLWRLEVVVVKTFAS